MININLLIENMTIKYKFNRSVSVKDFELS